MSDYSDVWITDIRRGKGSRSHIIYARLVNGKGETLISATLDFIVEALKHRMPKL
jgi:hypothetical protein